MVGGCTQARGRGGVWDAQTLGSQAIAGSLLWRLSGGHGQRRCPACSLHPAVQLLGWLPDGWFPVREAWGHCFCSHRRAGILPVAPRHSAREATEQILKVGIALGASWPREGMSSFDQAAFTLELPAPRARCPQPKAPPQRCACTPAHAAHRPTKIECPRVPSSDGVSAEQNSSRHRGLPGLVARLCWVSHPGCAGITGVPFHNAMFPK